MDLYRKVRLACAEGMSQREAARHFGVSRDSIGKMLAFSVPPGYRRSAPFLRPKLDGFTGIIDRWLSEDRDRPRKQRHTAKRIFERLRDEHGFAGGYTIIKDYVREHGRRHREMFVPLDHAPGHAQADFGEAVVVIGGVEQKAHFFALDLPHSDACYIRAYPAATAEAWMDGHVHAFAFFGAVPQLILYDNDRCLVAKIEPDGTRRSGGEVIARHVRSYDREDMLFDPVHYLPLIEKKIGAFDQAAPLAGWNLPKAFATLQRLMEARLLKAGRREYVQVLRLLETFEMEEVHAAVRTALQMGAISFDAVKHLVLCRVERRPPRLDLDVYPYLPRARVATTSPASYMCLR